MWTVAIIIIALLAFHLLSSFSNSASGQKMAKAGGGAVSAHQEQGAFLNFDYPPQGPIFSPDRRHVWDQARQKWIPINRGVWGGLAMGFILALIVLGLLGALH